MARANCLFLVLTGGEPLMRKDFARIYTSAAECGLVVTLFTNATRVDDRCLSLLRDIPPRIVDVSLYGATAPVYERMTGVAGSFDRCVRGIDRLLAAGLTVRLKSVLTTINAGEFEAMRRFAEQRKCPFRIDPAVSCRLDGDRAPTAWRLDPRRAARMEMSMTGTAAKVLELVDLAGRRPAPDRRFPCAAARTSFHVSSDGRLHACLMAPSPSVSLRGRTFGTAWRELVRLASRPPSAAARRSPCRTCNLRSICGFCAPMLDIECASGGQDSIAFFCDMGKARLTEAQHRVTEQLRV
jgi:radical SAM protein with 4Fe4S-binding SPASM domain